MSKGEAKTEIAAPVLSAGGWEDLLARARLMMDEDAVGRYEARKATAEKKLRRQGLEAVPVDLGKVKSALVRYSETLRYRESLEAAGVSRSEMTLALDLWPEAKVVLEFVRKIRDDEFEHWAPDRVVAYRDQLDKLAMDDAGECKANTKAVMFALERLDRKNFGEESEARGPSEGRQTIYQITGIQINNLPAEKMQRILPAEGVVDVGKVLLAAAKEGSADG